MMNIVQLIFDALAVLRVPFAHIGVDDVAGHPNFVIVERVVKKEDIIVQVVLARRSVRSDVVVDKGHANVHVMVIVDDIYNLSHR